MTANDERRDAPDGGAEDRAPEQPATGEPAPEGAAAGDKDAAERPEPAGEGDRSAPDREEPKERSRRAGEKKPEQEVVPGADLEPDLVLEDEESREGAAEVPYAEPYAQQETPPGEPEAEPPAAEPHAAVPGEAPDARAPRDIAADARYGATGKRKTSVARVILKPGEGRYLVNGRSLEEFFPRPTLQRTAREPLETAGYAAQMDVVAKIHGGGVSSQAGALRHGVARALVDADPNLRGEMKRRGFLTRDARVKERRKAGLKKARKRPQFSKR